MPTFAIIPDRPLRIFGSPRGWAPADADDPASRILPFRFDITDDGGKHFLLNYESLDGQFCSDTWHASLEEAFLAAEEAFGIARAEWDASAPNPALERTPTAGDACSVVHAHTPQ